MTKTPEPHPAAAAWPMLPEPDLRRLAEDVRANGLRHPIVLDAGGLILDGRNRLAACQIAGVTPEYETYDGDPVAYVLSANNERRHLSLPERAAATALTLATNGKRENGRWEYGAVSATEPENTGSRKSTWSDAMRLAGLVFDFLGAERLRRVAEGKEALDAAVQHARQAKAEQARIKDLPDDLRALVEADELTVSEAERRARLSERYAALVAAGDISLDEAEHLNDRDAREHREAIERAVSSIQTFVSVWKIARNLRDSPNRSEILNALPDVDRETFLSIEAVL